MKSYREEKIAVTRKNRDASTELGPSRCAAGTLKSYIDELLGEPCHGILARFGPLSHGVRPTKPTKTERLRTLKIL